MFTLSPSVSHRPSPPSFCRVTTANVKIAGGLLRSRTGLIKGATLQACCRESSDLSLLLKSNSILLGFVLFHFVRGAWQKTGFIYSYRRTPVFIYLFKRPVSTRVRPVKFSG